ncbi:hybrid sensor histidine kinase/response regulator [Pigmentiphaga sp. H8]|uniref:ATP-binding response regulator n=1 Tax=unclassified Pigmentiphaga TaxID=2626614 RepID=UPI000F59BBCE|nr:hybrid sensor histidine kinase/response regulator [Pigmentiphaga sp. H8]AZG07234.1 hybrid sensor histidine kinase/response regulator [Pigmentiphaga sp. H8]
MAAPPRLADLARRSVGSVPLAVRLMLLSLVPAAVAILLAMSVLARHHLTELTELTENNARAVARQVATLSRTSLMRMDRRAMLNAARVGSQQPGVRQVQIRTLDGEIVAQSGFWTKPTDPPGLEVLEPIDSEESARAGEVMVEFDLDSIAAARRNLWSTLAALLGASLLGVGIAGWWAARRISAPIRKLAEVVDRLGEGEEVEVDTGATAEVGRLQHGFKVAAQALADSRRTMKSQIVQATQELALKNAQLEAANQGKTRLLAAASHDLRQPLHALTLFADALRSDETDPPRLACIASIQECVHSLDRLFSELLNLSQIDAGAVRVQRAVFPLDHLFDDISRNFRPQAEEQGLRLVVRKTDAWVDCDYVMLSRILNNLVSNALRHTTQGGVLVGARRDAGGMRIGVWDTGVGIAPEHQHKVFEEFYQVDASSSRGSRGLGLGLATVRRLCDLLDMPLRLQSRVGRGTVVTVVAPAAAPAEVPPSCPAQGAQVDFTGMFMLVVDDEPNILEGLSLVLRNWGAEVAVAESRAQVLALAGQWARPPDVVITDLLLRDGENGLEVLRALDAHPGMGGRRAARLLVTGETKPDRLREIAEAGIAVLHKPVTSEVLRQALAAVLRDARGDRYLTA